MSNKTVNFNKTEISKLPNNKPVVYDILSQGGNTNYIGVAQGRRVQGRLVEHLPGAKDYVPGDKVRIRQMPSIDEAKKVESRMIERDQPKYNKQGT